VAVWVLGQSPLKGQMLGAIFLGSLAAGLVGRLVSPHVQPILLMVAPIVAGAAGHLVGAALLRHPLGVAYVQNALSPLSIAMPIDYAAGSLAGVAVGLGWARTFLMHEQPHETATV
jgi:hypothetical protein